MDKKSDEYKSRDNDKFDPSQVKLFHYYAVNYGQETYYYKEILYIPSIIILIVNICIIKFGFFQKRRKKQAIM